MPQTDRVVQAAKAAIQRAKHRHSDEVSPDDLLVALLRQAGRFGVALIGDWAIDVTALDDVPADARVEG
ncbi:MAG: hypothetical protein HYS40_09745, partial [Gemmatimonadetes bacterium]|nr:hypothetical protein [Gemmatimonadota bacterium]